MKLTGSQVIPASRETIWKGLNDPTILKQCIQGCEEITQESATSMKAKVGIKLGPVKTSFNGVVTLSDLKPPVSYRISGKGEGGLAGFASGGAFVKLTAINSTETQLDYDVDAQVGGKLAMLGSRLIDSTAKSLAQQFFTKFSALMAAQAGAVPKTARAASSKPKETGKRKLPAKSGKTKAPKPTKKPKGR